MGGSCSDVKRLGGELGQTARADAAGLIPPNPRASLTRSTHSAIHTGFIFTLIRPAPNQCRRIAKPSVAGPART